MNQYAIDTVPCDAFTPHVDKEFALVDDQGRVLAVVTLRATTELRRATAPDAPRNAFSIELSCPLPEGEAGLNSGTYVLANPEFGTIGPLYVTRVTPGELRKGNAWYQVNFN